MKRGILILLGVVCIVIAAVFGCNKYIAKSKVSQPSLQGAETGFGTEQIVNSSKQMNDIRFHVEGIPSEELAKRAGVSLSDKNAMAEYEKFVYLHLKIENVKGLPIMDYNSIKYATTEDKIKYFSFQLKNKIEMVNGDSIVPCTIYHYEKEAGIIPYINVMLGFERRKLPDALWTLRWFDDFFGFGELNLDISKN